MIKISYDGKLLKLCFRFWLFLNEIKSQFIFYLLLTQVVCEWLWGVTPCITSNLILYSIGFPANKAGSSSPLLF